MAATLNETDNKNIDIQTRLSMWITSPLRLALSPQDMPPPASQAAWQ
jgi:hypothetical protein